MGLLSRWRTIVRAADVAMAADDGPGASREVFSWAPGRQPWLPGGTYVGTSAMTGKVSRDEALSVPAVLRGRNLICSIAALPLRQLGADNDPARSPLLDQIDPNVANVVTLAQTIDDLIFDGVSWWQILGNSYDAFPTGARHIDSTAVSVTPPPGFSISTLPSGVFPEGYVFVMGVPVDARAMVRFDSPNPPLCTAGARAIRRALKLAQASEMYADDPEARAYWTPAEGADPADDDEIREMLREYAAARRNGSEAYIPAAVKRTAYGGMSPVDLQLSQLQQRSDLEIANLLGIDPEDIGVNTTSRTYANAVDRRVDQVNQTLGVYMKAITDRLSMNDITRRGYRVEFDLTKYMQADPATRWATYGVALDKGVLSVPEVRARENLPAVPVEPAARPAPAQQIGAPMQNKALTGREVAFAAEPGDLVTVQFAADEAFATNAAKRTVSGTVLPYGVQTSDSRKIKFAANSVTWNRSAVSQIKLDREHDKAQLLGAATELKASDAGITGRFKIARTPAGDEALSLAEDGALDGLSAVVQIDNAIPDPASEGGVIVTAATLRRVTLTSDPAFSDARVTTVAASAERGTEKGPQMPPTTEETTTQVVDVSAFTSAVEAFTAAVEQLGQMPREQRETVNPSRATVREPLVYSLTGIGDSFVKDAWDARNASYGSKQADDAMARLRKYGEQTAELQAAESARVAAFANAGNTTDQAQIIPPGYRPDLYVGQIPQGRPLFDSIGTRVTLANATAFKVPVWVGSSSLSGTNSEGTGPSTGTITDHTYRTVSPTAQSGEFVVTRELMDSSNPAIDLIALNAMREEYAQDTEAIIATAVAAATDDGTPVQGVSSDTSTEGCYVYTVTGTGNDLAIDGARFMEGEYPGHRFLTPDRMLASSTGYTALVRAVDDVGRPLFPFLAPQNALGAVGRAAASLNVDGLAVPNAWSLTDGTNDLVLFTSNDLLVGESPLLTFRFEEKGGPENIYLNIWGYFCFQILRYTGLHSTAYTAA